MSASDGVLKQVQGILCTHTVPIHSIEKIG